MELRKKKRNPKEKENKDKVLEQSSDTAKSLDGDGAMGTFSLSIGMNYLIEAWILDSGLV